MTGRLSSGPGRVLVTGPTGVLGRAAITLLRSTGTEIVTLARSSDAERRAREAGATPHSGELDDPAAVRAAMRGVDAVMHLATRIPPSWRARSRRSWLENDRLRVVATRVLVDAALVAGVGTFIYPSVALVQADAAANSIRGSDAPLDPVWPVSSTLVAENEVGRFAAEGRRGVSLRLGQLYGPTSRDALERLALARRGWSLEFGERRSFSSNLWVEDAATALVAALAAPSGTYLVAEKEPRTQDEQRSALALAVGRTRLRRVPPSLVRLLAGRELVRLLGASRRLDSGAFEDVTGWMPRVPNVGIGWKLAAAALA